MPQPKALVLAIDIGSSSTRSALFTAAGTRVSGSEASRQYSIDYTASGGAELNALLLLQATRSCVAKTLKARTAPVTAVGGSAFWHSLLGVDESGNPLTPVFTWADARGAPDAAQLRAELSEREIQLRTGCMLRAPFWPAKLHWLRRTDPKRFRSVPRWRSPAAWIFEKLFGVGSTSHSMASGTGLYDLGTGTWDSQLCELCGIDEKQLGAISDEAFVGERSAKHVAGATIFPALGDGAASNIGSGAVAPQTMAINIGTSAAARVVELRDSPRTRLPLGLFRYVVDAERTLVGGAISNAGNLREWSLRNLRLSAGDATVSRTLAADNPLTVIPFWVHERAPTWPEQLNGAIAGLKQTTTAADIFNALTTATFYRLAQIVEEIGKGPGRRSDAIVVSGGILKSRPGLNILADALGRDLRLSSELESSLRGAAIYALRRCGHEARVPVPGATVHFRETLAAKHRVRRDGQIALERGLLNALPAPRESSAFEA